MLDIGWQELILIAILAIVVVGPKDLPKMMRVVGQWTGKARAMAREFQQSFEQMAQEAELEELRKEVNQIKDNNPLTELRDDIQKIQDPFFPDEPDPAVTDPLKDNSIHPPSEEDPDGSAEDDKTAKAAVSKDALP